VNDCPQDQRFIQLFLAVLGPALTVFSHGESAGWVAPVCLRLGVDCVCTEPDAYSFYYLRRRLQLETGNLILKTGLEQDYWKRVHSFLKSSKRKDKAREEKVRKVSRLPRLSPG
jgi:hypothetical protein